jgi:uncharacterized membrane protein YeaQ/YmgE (transglycosylase-associated protein family)
MVMEIVLWIIFGALAGWIASIIMGTNAEQGAVANIAVGIIGAFIGGFFVRMLTGMDVQGFNFGSFIVAAQSFCWQSYDFSVAARRITRDNASRHAQLRAKDRESRSFACSSCLTNVHRTFIVIK